MRFRRARLQTISATLAAALALVAVLLPLAHVNALEQSLGRAAATAASHPHDAAPCEHARPAGDEGCMTGGLCFTVCNALSPSIVPHLAIAKATWHHSPIIGDRLLPRDGPAAFRPPIRSI